MGPGVLPLPIQEPPTTASDTLRTLYNQLRSFFMMAQKSGSTLQKPDSPNPEILSQQTGPQRNDAPAVADTQFAAGGTAQPPVPAPPSTAPMESSVAQPLQAQVATQPATSLPAVPPQAQPVTGKRDRAGSEQAIDSTAPDAKRERLDAAVPPTPTKKQTRQTKAAVKAQKNSEETFQPPQPPSQSQKGQKQPKKTVNQASQDTAGSQTSRAPTPRLAGKRPPSRTGTPAQLAGTPLPTTPLPQYGTPSQPPHSATFPPLNQYASTIPPHIQQHIQQAQTIAQNNAAGTPGSNSSLQSPFATPSHTGSVAPSPLSAQVPLPAPAGSQAQQARFASLPPGTPSQAQFFPPNQGQPGPPGYQPHGQQGGQAFSQGPMPYQQGQAMQQPGQGQMGAGPPQGQIPRSGAASLDALVHDMLRLQDMLQSGRTARATEEIYNKLPPDARQTLDERIRAQEAQLDQMRRIYDLHMRSQAQHQASAQNQLQSGQQPNQPQPGQMPVAGLLQQQGGPIQPSQMQGFPTHTPQMQPLQQQQPGFAMPNGATGQTQRPPSVMSQGHMRTSSLSQVNASPPSMPVAPSPAPSMHSVQQSPVVPFVRPPTRQQSVSQLNNGHQGQQAGLPALQQNGSLAQQVYHHQQQQQRQFSSPAQQQQQFGQDSQAGP